MDNGRLKVRKGPRAGVQREQDAGQLPGEAAGEAHGALTNARAGEEAVSRLILIHVNYFHIFDHHEHDANDTFILIFCFGTSPSGDSLSMFISRGNS